ncbi:hypothetical protein HBH75_239060 [Parastagonospora nodorum]|nr:hypothetical protein HBH75_239060 [Parastagonospora nodorum]
MIKFCWTKACLLYRAALKLKHYYLHNFALTLTYYLSILTLKELGARHSLLNLSVYDLVEEQRNYSLCLSCLIRLQH